MSDSLARFPSRVLETEPRARIAPIFRFLETTYVYLLETRLVLLERYHFVLRTFVEGSDTTRRKIALHRRVFSSVLHRRFYYRCNFIKSVFGCDTCTRYGFYFDANPFTDICFFFVSRGNHSIVLLALLCYTVRVCTEGTLSMVLQSTVIVRSNQELIKNCLELTLTLFHFSLWLKEIYASRYLKSTVLQQIGCTIWIKRVAELRTHTCERKVFV